MKWTILGIVDIVEKINSQVKENIKCKKIPDIKCSGNVEQYEKIKHKSDTKKEE